MDFGRQGVGVHISVGWVEYDGWWVDSIVDVALSLFVSVQQLYFGIYGASAAKSQI